MTTDKGTPERLFPKWLTDSFADQAEASARRVEAVCPCGGSGQGGEGCSCDPIFAAGGLSDSTKPAYPTKLYPGCPCYTCDSKTWPKLGNWTDALPQRMSVCPRCGDKRCAAAGDHTRACS